MDKIRHLGPDQHGKNRLSGGFGYFEGLFEERESKQLFE